MIVSCENCSKKFVVKDSDIPDEGRMVQCGYCSVTWHQMPVSTTGIQKPEIIIEADNSPSIDGIKASDGKTYKFLGSQWAEILPSGKTGLFARKKISRELDTVTGRKEKKISRKKQKRIEEVDPSSEYQNNKNQPANIHESKKGLGFFGYIFLIIIIGFSIVGVLMTFKDDLLTTFPETEFIFIFLDEQLEYVSESVKNIIVIINDLIDSY